MSNEISKNKKVNTDTEIGVNGVVHSKTESSEAASAAELSLALEMTQKALDAMAAENAKLRAERAEAPKQPQSNSNDTLAELVKAIQNLSNSGNAGPAEADNINRTSDFTNKMNVDGRSLMEAQQTLMMFKNETKKPISIPKAFINQFGPSLVVTVNGVRVAIPVDGKTYYINETHWLHARERIAKLDLQLAKTEPQIIETNA